MRWQGKDTTAVKHGTRSTPKDYGQCHKPRALTTSSDQPREVVMSGTTPSDPTPGPNTSDSRSRMIVLAIAFVAIELLGLVGIVMAPGADLGQVAIFAVSGALVLVPILFAIALRSNVRK